MQKRFPGLGMDVNEHNLATLRETSEAKPLCVIFTDKILSSEVLGKYFYGSVFINTISSNLPRFGLAFG
jgi:hypothetical protein